MQFPQVRLRRLRQSNNFRRLVRDVELSPGDFILPLFIKEGKDIKNPISSMPGHYQLSLDHLADEIHDVVALNIPAVILFGIPKDKDASGAVSCQPSGIIQQAIKLIKDIAPELLVITDNCFCEYTLHGHCGIINQKGEVDNDATLTLLGQQAIAFAEAGADMLAPSGMMDGMIKTMRIALDENGFRNMPIMSYAVKYCSAFYGAFREAAESTPQFGSRHGYQMDPARSKEALGEASQDIAEGADIIMVKPAQSYLDIIYQIKQRAPEVPLAAYQVSGEYAMIKAAHEKGWLDEKQTAIESLLAIKRAGADCIINYFAKDVIKWMQ